jgi:prepilin-type N-terminal cleavage/methylation domain-containing protein
MKATGSKGFTILEVLFALAILIISVCSLSMLHLASTLTDSHNDNLLLATNLCNYQIEYLRTQPFVTATTTGAGRSGRFTINWTITPVLPWQDTVTVTVSWQEKEGSIPIRTVNRTLRMSSIIVNLNVPPA